ncbi:hypothetical protein Tco_1270071, partial [Tanacetum coccineum]
ADIKEDDDEDHEEDPVDYPADGGDDGDDEDESSMDDEDDDEVDIEADDEEEEEHPSPADSVVVALLAADQASSTEETESISIPALVPTPVWSDAEVARLLAISTPPSSSPSSWSSPVPQIPSPPLPLIPSPSLPVSPPLPLSSPVPVLSPSPPTSPICPLGYRATMIRLRAEAASTSHSLPLPLCIIPSHTRPAAPSSRTPPLHLLSIDHREDRPEVTLPPRKREIKRDPERDVGYGITDSWDEIVETLQGALVSTDTELGRHMIAFETRVRHDPNEIYTWLDDEQSGRQLLAGQLNILFRDRRAHARAARLMETKARMSREA